MSKELIDKLVKRIIKDHHSKHPDSNLSTNDLLISRAYYFDNAQESWYEDDDLDIDEEIMKDIFPCLQLKIDKYKEKQRLCDLMHNDISTLLGNLDSEYAEYLNKLLEATNESN